jgi:hypothetical protein
MGPARLVKGKSVRVSALLMAGAREPQGVGRSNVSDYSSIVSDRWVRYRGGTAASTRDYTRWTVMVVFIIAIVTSTVALDVRFNGHHGSGAC